MRAKATSKFGGGGWIWGGDCPSYPIASYTSSTMLQCFDHQSLQLSLSPILPRALLAFLPINPREQAVQLANSPSLLD